MGQSRNEDLQTLCRHYLSSVRHLAERFGLGKFVDDTIEANTRHECEGTHADVEMLARICDDDRLSRQEVPRILGKSYRQCNDDGDFDKIKKLRRVGIYSKVSTLLHRGQNIEE